MGGERVLSRKGRETADEIAACHWEIELARAFDERDRCEVLAFSHGLDRIDAGTKRTTFRLDGDPVIVDYGRGDFLSSASEIRAGAEGTGA